MNVLVACEHTGIVRDAFRARGHNAISCDLLPSDVGGPHFEMDVLTVLRDHGHAFDLMIMVVVFGLLFYLLWSVSASSYFF